MGAHWVRAKRVGRVTLIGIAGTNIINQMTLVLSLQGSQRQSRGEQGEVPHAEGRT